MLNVLTPKGRDAENAAREAILKLQKEGQSFVWFPEHNFFPVDGFVTSGSSITAIFEGKSRRASFADGQMMYNGKAYSELLITANKIDNGVKLAQQMGINFYIIIHFELSDLCVSFKVYNQGTHRVIEHKRRNTRTQAGANGGSVVRDNAYIDFSLCNVGFVL